MLINSPYIQAATKLHVVAGVYYNGRNKLPLILVNDQNTNNWRFVAVKHTLPEKLNDLSITNLDCTNTNCALVGNWRDRDWHQLPLLITTLDSGATFSFINTINNLPAKMSLAMLYDSVCNNHFCLGIGIYDDSKDEKPFLITSQNSGVTWQFNTLNDLPAVHENELRKAYCNNRFCLAAGNLTDLIAETGKPFIVKKSNSKSWQVISAIKNLPHNFKSILAEDIYCLNETCLLVGSYNAYGNLVDPDRNKVHPFIAISNDEGDSWQFIDHIENIPFSNLLGRLNTTQCLDKGKVCFVGGYYNHSNQMIFWKSTDHGKTWLTIPEGKREGGLLSMSCDENNCVTVGGTMLLTSLDKGSTWTQRTVDNAAGNIHLAQVRCDGSLCYAVGEYAASDLKWLPLLLVSNDHGWTWHWQKHILNIPADIKEGMLWAA